MLLYAVALASAHRLVAPSSGGWLYPGGITRLVRFDVATDDPANSDSFYPVPQTSGFILIDGDTFSMSFAEVWGTALLEYKKGVLRERCMTGSDGGLGNFRPRSGERLTFGKAFAAAMTEVATYSLGALCLDLLANPKVRDSAETIHEYAYKAVLGAGRGALQSFTEVTPWLRKSGRFKRIVCTFTVVIGRRD